MVGKAWVPVIEDGCIFGVCAEGVVPEADHLLGGYGPELLEGCAGITVYERVGSDGSLGLGEEGGMLPIVLMRPALRLVARFRVGEGGMHAWRGSATSEALFEFSDIV